MRHEESKIQQACVRWFRYEFPEYRKNLVAIPNGYKTTISQARIAKAEGLVSGASDLVLFYPAKGYHGLCLEMKTEKGKQQDTQKEFQKAVESVGYKYIICRSLDDFIREIKNYIFL